MESKKLVLPYVEGLDNAALLGMALDLAGVTAGLSVILLCVLYLIYCAFGVKIQS